MEHITKMSRAVLPTSVNARGILFGGELMAWMDEISGIAAKRFAGKEVATVSVADINFLHPIPVGAFIDLNADIVSVGVKSLKVKIDVIMDAPEPVKAAEALFVYVTINDDGKPVPVDRTL